MFRHEDYFINKKGIYRTEKAYHDDVDYIYVVDFEKDKMHEEFRRFMDQIFQSGKKARSREIKHLSLEIDMKKNFWPDDGGLKEPVRSFDEAFNGFKLLVEKYFKKDKESS